MDRAGRRSALLGLFLVAATAATAATAAGALSALNAAPASASTTVARGGVTGTYSLKDTAQHPGAWLAYDPVTMIARSVTARPPIVHAVDSSAGVNHQLVGARARLQRLAKGSTTWTTIATSAEKRGVATETSSPFHDIVVVKPTLSGLFRVQWLLSWYSGPNTRTGSATVQIDWYGERIGPWLDIGTRKHAARSSLAGIPAVRVRHGPRKTPTVALTFDFGGRIGDAKSIVHWLIDHDIPSTVFSVGVTAKVPAGTRPLEIAARHPELFDFGNHSETHPDFTKIGAAEIADELERADRTIKAIVGKSTQPLFRAPYGKIDKPALAAMGKAGWSMNFDWDTTTSDYLPVSDGGPTVSELVHQVLSQARSGSIVVLHLGGYNTYSALPAIVNGLRDKGLEPVTLTTLLRLNS